MHSAQDRFERRLLACVGDLNRLLPGLTARFEAMVVISAFAVHVGSAMQLLLRGQVWDAPRARALMGHIEALAFADERGGANGASGTPETLTTLH
jgi:hypothetical protein